MHKSASDQESVEESDEGPAARSTRTRSKSPVDKAAAKIKVAPTARFLCSHRSLPPIAPLPTLPPLAPYALAARSLRSRRSLHTIPPLAPLPTRPNTL